MTNDRKQALDNFRLMCHRWTQTPKKVVIMDGDVKEIEKALSQPTPQELCDKIVKRLEGKKEHPRLTPDHEIDRAEFEAKNDTLNKAIEIVKEVCGD